MRRKTIPMEIQIFFNKTRLNFQKIKANLLKNPMNRFHSYKIIAARLLFDIFLESFENHIRLVLNPFQVLVIQIPIFEPDTLQFPQFFPLYFIKLRMCVRQDLLESFRQQMPVINKRLFMQPMVSLI